jgi:hypothetical protein
MPKPTRREPSNSARKSKVRWRHGRGRVEMRAVTISKYDEMVAWDRVNRADVLCTIKEYDRVGQERFFSEHGFAPTTTYELDWEERRYPPKAILGTTYEFATGRRPFPGRGGADLSGSVNTSEFGNRLLYYPSVPFNRPGRLARHVIDR